MNSRARLVVFGLACLVLAVAAVRLAVVMPTFGDHAMPYGDAVNAVGPAERHVTNMVSAVNFDIRGFDTLGEEFMLVCAVTGTVVLLRGNRGETLGAKPGRVKGRAVAGRSDAMALTARVLSPVVVLFGIYVALHAMTTPGGGFQGGVIIASGILLLFLGEGYASWREGVRSGVLDAMEGFGATLYGLAGIAGLALGLPYLTNVLPYGALKDVFSGGLMLVENAGTAMAVTAGFCILLLEFLEETRAVTPGDEREEDEA